MRVSCGKWQVAHRVTRHTRVVGSGGAAHITLRHEHPAPQARKKLRLHPAKAGCASREEASPDFPRACPAGAPTSCKAARCKGTSCTASRGATHNATSVATVLTRRANHINRLPVSGQGCAKQPAGGLHTTKYGLAAIAASLNTALSRTCAFPLVLGAGGVGAETSWPGAVAASADLRPCRSGRGAQSKTILRQD